MLDLQVGELTQARVLEFLDEYREAYDRSDDSVFGCYTQDASFFTVSSTTRIDSLEEFKRSLGPSSVAKRRTQFMAPEIRIHGDSAVVTCHQRTSVDGEVTNLRATLSLVVRAGQVKISHLHTSLLPLPAAPGGKGRHVEEISILEERVATAAAQVGTPK
jgi:ketosteroid isomerase-like protein